MRFIATFPYQLACKSFQAVELNKYLQLLMSVPVVVLCAMAVWICIHFYFSFTELGFAGVSGNSLDATSDRDFIGKYLSLLVSYVEPRTFYQELGRKFLVEQSGRV